MKTHLALALALTLLLATAPVFAGSGTPSDASLKGTYTFQHLSPQMEYVAQSITCSLPLGGTNTFTQWFDAKNNQVIQGAATFDGAGNASVNATQSGVLNLAASQATIQLACDGNGNGIVINSGHAVYDAPAPLVTSGTYQVNSDGTGTLNLAGAGVALNLQIAGTGKRGVAKTFYFFSLHTDILKVDGAGSGTLQ